MWKNVLRHVNRQHHIVLLFFCLNFWCMLFMFLSIICIWGILKEYRKDILPMCLFNWFAEIVLLIICIIVYRYLKKAGAGKNDIEPYIVYISPLSYKGLLQHISEVTDINCMDEGFYSSEEMWTRFLCIFNYMNEYESEAFRQLQGKAVKRVRSECGFRDQMSIAKTKRITRIHINSFNSINDPLNIKEIRRNAAFDVGFAEAVVNIYIDLSRGIVYIPAYIGIWLRESSKYRNAIVYLSHLFREMWI